LTPDPIDFWYCGVCGSQLDHNMKCPNCVVESVPQSRLDEIMPEWKSNLSEKMRKELREKFKEMGK
jgi:hypothetical protein